jgi:hypothetical protein
MCPGWYCEVVSKIACQHRTSGTYHDLLGFSKEIARVGIELHEANQLDWRQLLRDDLRRIQQIEAKLHNVRLLHNLHAKLPRRTIPGCNSIPEILAVEVGILPCEHLRLLPDKTRLALLCLPVPLDELRRAGVGDEAERVHAEAVHVAVGSRDAVARHGPEQRVQRARFLAKKVPRRIVSRRSLWDFLVRAGLDGVDQVREENGILNEEDWDIIADDVCWRNDILEESVWELISTGSD